MNAIRPVPIIALILLCFVLPTGCTALAVEKAVSSGLSEKQQALAKKLQLPPDPGEAGKATLLGIDSDNDGVRDDIQRYIALTYPDSAKKRAALRQDAKAMNDALRDADEKRASIKNSYQMDRAQECSAFIWDSVRESANEGKKLQAQILNTQERTSAYFDYDGQLGGEVFSSTPLKFWNRSCEFDPNVLPN